MTAATAERLGIEFEQSQQAAAIQIPARRAGRPADVANTITLLARRGRVVRVRASDPRPRRSACLTRSG
jgi:NAD(P)-dependent dehydrogenase (short-subunit alcohol dehydrogenase family)